MAYSSASLDVGDLEPQWWCDHGDGEHSLMIGRSGKHTTYLAGSYTELHAFATQLVALTDGLLHTEELNRRAAEHADGGA